MSKESVFNKWAYSTIGFSIGVIAIGFPFACSIRSRLEETTRILQGTSAVPVKATAPVNPEYSFKDMGNHAVIYPGGIYSSAHIKQIALGDMDGDGDLDIVTLREDNRVRIYENKIPQKNLLESLKGKDILER